MSRETYTATVDRIVDGDHVVLLLESDDRVVDELVLPRERAPGLEAGDVVSVDLESEAVSEADDHAETEFDGDELEVDDVVEIRRDETETDRRRRDLRDRFDRLSERLPGSDDADDPAVGAEADDDRRTDDEDRADDETQMGDETQRDDETRAEENRADETRDGNDSDEDSP